MSGDMNDDKKVCSLPTYSLVKILAKSFLVTLVFSKVLTQDTRLLGSRLVT